jgi:hypothetical protein
MQGDGCRAPAELCCAAHDGRADHRNGYPTAGPNRFSRRGCPQVRRCPAVSKSIMDRRFWLHDAGTTTGQWLFTKLRMCARTNTAVMSMKLSHEMSSEHVLPMQKVTLYNGLPMLQ